MIGVAGRRQFLRSDLHGMDSSSDLIRESGLSVAPSGWLGLRTGNLPRGWAPDSRCSRLFPEGDSEMPSVAVVAHEAQRFSPHTSPWRACLASTALVLQYRSVSIERHPPRSRAKAATCSPGIPAERKERVVRQASGQTGHPAARSTVCAVAHGVDVVVHARPPPALRGLSRQLPSAPLRSRAISFGASLADSWKSVPQVQPWRIRRWPLSIRCPS